MDIDAKFVEGTLDIVGVAAVAGYQNGTHRVEVDLIGKAGQVVLLLGVAVTHRNNRLVALTKPAERLRDFLKFGQTTAEQIIQFQHQRGNAGVLSGLINGLCEIVHQRFCIGRATLLQ